MPSERELIPEGTYRVKPVKAAWRESTEKKTKFLAVAFSIVEGDFAGRIVTWNGWMTENTWERTVDSMRHMGFATDDLRDLSGLKDEVSVEVEHEQYTNDKGEEKEVAKVSWVNALGASFGNPLAPDEMATFAEKMRGRLQRKGMKGSQPTAGVADDGPPPIDDDDIPF
jgi:hypothetical protein